MNLPKTEPIAPWVDRETILFLCSLKPTFLRGLRDTREWIEGVHYNYLNPQHPKGGIIYNSVLCLDWAAKRHDPEAHKEAIQLYCKQLEEHALIKSLSSIEALSLQVCRATINAEKVQ